MNNAKLFFLFFFLVIVSNNLIAQKSFITVNAGVYTNNDKATKFGFTFQLERSLNKRFSLGIKTVILSQKNESLKKFDNEANPDKIVTSYHHSYFILFPLKYKIAKDLKSDFQPWVQFEFGICPTNNYARVEYKSINFNRENKNLDFFFNLGLTLGTNYKIAKRLHANAQLTYARLVGTTKNLVQDAPFDASEYYKPLNSYFIFSAGLTYQIR